MDKAELRECANECLSKYAWITGYENLKERKLAQGVLALLDELERVPPREPTEKMRSEAFNRAEGFSATRFSNTRTPTAQDFLDAFYGILDAATEKP